MASSDRNDPDEIRKRSRSRKDAPREGIGGEEEGIRLPVPSYTEDDRGGDEAGVDPRWLPIAVSPG